MTDDMTQKEVMEEMTTLWMQNDAAARVFGFEVGASFDSVYPKASVLRLLMWVVSGVIALKETLLEEWKEEVRQVAEETHYGTAAWWVDVVKRWQMGDPLTVVDGKVGYQTVDETKRLVTSASVTVKGRTLLLKVAKGASGERTALTEAERLSLVGYVEEVKPLGLMVTVRSGQSNKVDLGGVVRYKAELDEDDVKEAVREAVEKCMDGLEFNGDLYEGRLAMALMQAEGVVDVHLSGLKIDGTEWSDVVNPTNGYVELGTDGMEYVRV